MTTLKRLRPSQARAAFEALVSATMEDLAGLIPLLERGANQEWYERFDARLFRSHTGAWRYGRALGGDDEDETEEDRLQGRAIADLQSNYLLGFLDDIENGRYTDKDGNLNAAAIRQRSNLYAKALKGTANESWTESGPDDEMYDWVLGAAEHCEDCLELAELGPYEKGTLFTWPGKGQTACLVNCECTLRAVSSGVTGF